jgi:hypothetical protein
MLSWRSCALLWPAVSFPVTEWFGLPQHLNGSTRVHGKASLVLCIVRRVRAGAPVRLSAVPRTWRGKATSGGMILVSGVSSEGEDAAGGPPPISLSC